MCNDPDEWNPREITIEYEWEIHCFSTTNCHESGDCIKSPNIYCYDKYKDIVWRLLLYPKGLNKDLEDYASLFVICESTEYIVPTLPSKIQCTLVDFKDKSWGTSEGEKWDIRDDESVNCWGFPKFTTRKILLNFSDYCKSDHRRHFRIKCTMDVHGPIFPRIECQLHTDFVQLLQSQKLSDVIIEVHERVFHGHKNILAARSPVFAAMFENEMLEKAESFVSIPDIDDEVFEDMLQYIYTGKIPNLKKTVFGLLPAADKYQIEKLKIMCEIYLYNNITTENVSDIMILADVYRSLKLKAKALNFINSNATKVIPTYGYESLCESHPHLINECYRALVTKMAKLGFM